MTDRDFEFEGPTRPRVAPVRPASRTASDGAPTAPLDWIAWPVDDLARGHPLPEPPAVDDPAMGLVGSDADRSVASPAGPAAPTEDGRWSLRAALADRLSPTLRGGRLDPSPRGAAALAVVALIAALVAAAFAWRARPTAVGVPAGPSAAAGQPRISEPYAARRATGGSAAAPLASASAELVVDVEGKVRHPGVVRVPAGSRVVDAVEKAGGVRPGTDTTGLALARKLTDGEQVLVTGQPGQPAAASAGTSDSGSAAGSAGPGAPGAPVNLNTATEAQLDSLPGVGPVLAQRIVQWRDQHGTFTSTRQLGEVEGLGEKRLAQLLPLVTV